jgi:hypothetical protein
MTGRVAWPISYLRHVFVLNERTMNFLSEEAWRHDEVSGSPVTPFQYSLVWMKLKDSDERNATWALLFTVLVPNSVTTRSGTIS